MTSVDHSLLYLSTFNTASGAFHPTRRTCARSTISAASACLLQPVRTRPHVNSQRMCRVELRQAAVADGEIEDQAGAQTSLQCSVDESCNASLDRHAGFHFTYIGLNGRQCMASQGQCSLASHRVSEGNPRTQSSWLGWYEHSNAARRLGYEAIGKS